MTKLSSFYFSIFWGKKTKQKQKKTKKPSLTYTLLDFIALTVKLCALGFKCMYTMLVTIFSV